MSKKENKGTKNVKSETAEYVIKLDKIELPKADKGKEIDFLSGSESALSEFIASAIMEQTNKTSNDLFGKIAENLGGHEAPDIQCEATNYTNLLIKSIVSGGPEFEHSYEATTTVKVRPDKNKDDYYAFTAITKFYPFDFKARRCREIIERYNAIIDVSADVLGSVFDSLWKVEKDILDLLDEDLGTFEIAVAKVEDKLDAIESKVETKLLVQANGS